MPASHADPYGQGPLTGTGASQDLLLVERVMHSMNLLKPAGPAIDQVDMLR